MKVIFSYADAQLTARNRPAGYLDDLLSKAIVKEGKVYMEEDVYRAFCEKYSPKPPPTLTEEMLFSPAWPTDPIAFRQKLKAARRDRPEKLHGRCCPSG